jgi:methylenetetrahydrofolate reductase (NADPH)
MMTFRDRLLESQDFMIGVELVTTRGTMQDTKARRTRRLASQLTDYEKIDWVSITDNAGGNPMLSPMALGKNILYAGKDVVIHLSCKDFNRHGLESTAWQLASEGFSNILALSGDYPSGGYRGIAKSVFDIDSVGLLTLLDEMNRGFGRPSVSHQGETTSPSLKPTNLLAGAVATNFKRHENEVVPQYLKMEKKLQVGARFLIAQIGFDTRKSHEMLTYLAQHGWPQVPLIGNVFLLTKRTADFFRSQRIPGVIISDPLFTLCEQQAKSPDQGQQFFRELAAQQMACFRGMGFRGAYLGGVHQMEEIQSILDLEASYAPDDWKDFAREICYPQPDEFYLYARDPGTGLADRQRLNPDYEKSRKLRRPSKNVTWGYRLSKWIHEAVFTPGKKIFQWGKTIYDSSRDPTQGPYALRIVEHASKAALFHCQDCGDCSLPDIAYLCPESQCAKNQRNGPCGGTRNGLCEVDDFECIWSRAYDRLKFEGRELAMLDHAPVIQDESLRGTSSWGNTFLGRDHHSQPIPKHDTSATDTTIVQPTDPSSPINQDPPTANPPATNPATATPPTNKPTL